MTRLRWLLVCFSLAFRGYGVAQQPIAALRGVVRESGGAPLAGVDVLLGRHQATTNAQGVFLVDSIRPGQYPITVRRVGYSPIRSRIAIAAGSNSVAYVLVPAPLLLPTLVSEGRRTGIYGSVADSSRHAAVGARVQVVGARGGEVLTDSAGRFAFPDADQGAYLVRVTFPGYLERRLSLELERGRGRELAVRLTPGFGSTGHADEQALQDLRLRLAAGFRRERMTAAGLARFGSDPLCEVPMHAGGNPIIVVNGVDVYLDMPRTFLCFWRADEVDLVEFGPDICREVSGTLKLLPRVRCAGSSRSRRNTGGGYILIWEKR